MKMMEWTDENIKKFWDYESQFKENYFTYQVGTKLVSHFDRLLENGSTVLDFGCGAGFLIDSLLAKNINVYGLDFSPDSVKQVSEKFKKMQNFKGAYLPEDIPKLGLKFDTIIATEVIEHLDDVKLNGMMEYVKQNLNPYGNAIFTTPNAEDLSKSYIYCPQSDVVFHRWQHVRSWDENSLKIYLSKYFSKVHVYTVNFDYFPSEFEIFKMNLRKKIKKVLGREHIIKNPHLVAIVSGE